MNQMMNDYGNEQKRLQNAADSLMMAAYVLQDYQNVLSRSYQSNEMTPILSLLRQSLEDLKGMRQSCNMLQRRFAGYVQRRQ